MLQTLRYQEENCRHAAELYGKVSKMFNASLTILCYIEHVEAKRLKANCKYILEYNCKYILEYNCKYI